MKNPSKHILNGLNDQKGVALLVTLTTLSLLIIVMLAMLGNSQRERKSSSLYKDGVYAESLAHQAVNFSVAQIREATSDHTKLWVSQPGAIRTYNEDGKFARGFKLYSDERMTVFGDEDAFTHEDAAEMPSWSSHPERWVDLNSPVIRDGKAYYPIANPDAATLQEVEGFEFQLDAVGGGPMTKALGKIGRQPLPMPVKWLYLLKDGTVGSLDENNEFVVFSINENGKENVIRGLATRENPIAARVAFWADDETSKVNVNTASEPTFWDTPRAAARGPGKIAVLALKEYDDRAYGWSQPGRFEFQRFPGHPAQTALSPVLFPGLKGEG